MQSSIEAELDGGWRKSMLWQEFYVLPICGASDLGNWNMSIWQIALLFYGFLSLFSSSLLFYPLDSPIRKMNYTLISFPSIFHFYFLLFTMALTIGKWKSIKFSLSFQHRSLTILVPVRFAFHRVLNLLSLMQGSWLRLLSLNPYIIFLNRRRIRTNNPKDVAKVYLYVN